MFKRGRPKKETEMQYILDNLHKSDRTLSEELTELGFPTTALGVKGLRIRAEIKKSQEEAILLRKANLKKEKA